MIMELYSLNGFSCFIHVLNRDSTPKRSTFLRSLSEATMLIALCQTSVAKIAKVTPFCRKSPVGPLLLMLPSTTTT